MPPPLAPRRAAEPISAGTLPAPGAGSWPPALGPSEATSAGLLVLPEQPQQSGAHRRSAGRTPAGRGSLGSGEGPGWPAGGERGPILPRGAGCWGGDGVQPAAYPAAEFRRLRWFVSKRTIYKLAFPGETPSPVGEPCESPSLCRAAGALPGCRPPGSSGPGSAQEVPEPQPWVQPLPALPQKVRAIGGGVVMAEKSPSGSAWQLLRRTPAFEIK